MVALLAQRMRLPQACSMEAPMQITAERGSNKLTDKLFDRGSTEEELLALLGAKHMKAGGAAALHIKNIWWYGQPAIDQILSTVHVDVASAGGVVDALLKLQHEALRVKVDVFPLGIPNPEIAQIDVTLHRNLGR
jgi:hypothetical protein